ncbi:MAG: hypothetical protein JWM59_5111 [Verrucomicrobiales bacterium]|nr:hypothetical protein [Verrucomicrobiales bacterium]
MQNFPTPPPSGSRLGSDPDLRVLHPLTIGLIIATIGGILFACFCAPGTLGILGSDDSFYYYLTARNFVLGNGVSFDGINPTNGFHPLWMLALIPLYAVTGGDHDLSLRLVYILLLLLFSGSIALTFRLLQAGTGKVPALLTLLVFINPVVFNLFFNGLESALLIFLLLLLLNVAQRRDLVSPGMGFGNQALAGLLFGLLFLSRLDCAFHLMALGLVALVVYRLPLWNPKELPSLIRSYGLLLLVFALVVAPYFAWNLTANGHLSPLSGALKSSFPHPEPRFRTLIAASRAPYSAFVIISLILAGIWILQPNSKLRRLFATRGADQPWNVLLLSLWLGCLLHYGYTLFFTTWGTHQWHFASYVPLILLSGGWLLSGLESRARWLAVSLSVLVLLVSCAMLVFSLALKTKQHRNWHVAAEWARNNTAPDSIFGMTDAGYFSYFSRRNTVNLDGLINGYEYQEALLGPALETYFKKCGIDYICDYEVPASRTGSHAIRLNRIPYAEKQNGKRGYDFAFPVEKAVYASAPFAPYSLRPARSAKDQIVFYIWPYEAGLLTPALQSFDPWQSDAVSRAE